MERRRANPGRLILLATLAAAAGCRPSRGPPSVTSDDPDLKVLGIKQDVAQHDERDEPQMVHDLDDPDPAVRFYAVEGLRRLTGDDFGYRYYDDDAARKPAVARWQSWVAGHGSTATAAANDGGPTAGAVGR